MDNYEIWDTASMAWTEIGIDGPEYKEHAEILSHKYDNWKNIDSVILRDVVGSFSLESSLFPLAFIPLIGMLLITPMPDWGYDEVYLRKRMKKWESRPCWVHYLNPLRIVGYPIAYLFIFGLRRKLRNEYYKIQNT